MAGDHPLGLAGGAGGKQDVQGVLRGQGVRPPLHLGGCHVPAGGQEIRPGRCSRFLALQQHDLLQRRQGVLAQRRGVVHPQEITDRKQQAGAAGAQYVGGLGPFQAGIEGHQHRADALGAGGGDNPLVDIGRPDGNPVALVDAGRHERLRGPHPGLVELRVIELHRAIADGRSLSVAGRGLRHDLGQGTLSILFCWHGAIPLGTVQQGWRHMVDGKRANDKHYS